MPRLSLIWPNRSLDTGANASAEEQEEGTEDNVETKIDVVHSFRLNETGFDKKGYLTYLKGKAHQHNTSTPVLTIQQAT